MMQFTSESKENIEGKEDKKAMMTTDRSPESISAPNESELIFRSIEHTL